MSLRHYFAAFTLLAALLPASAPAEDPAEARGMAVAKAADAPLRGYVDSTSRLEMILTSPGGETASRVLNVRSRESSNGDQVLMVFETPRDLAGTALLSWNHPGGDDEQWLYLPAVKRVKQVGSRNKSGPFMASEFAFEDIATPYWQKYRYRFLREEKLEGLPCAVIERTPLDANSGYTRQVVWIDTKDSLTRRIDYYDRRNTLLKTYVARGFQKYDGKHWRPAEMHMNNVQTNRQTLLRWSDYRFGLGLKEADFNQNALQRAK